MTFCFNTNSKKSINKKKTFLWIDFVPLLEVAQKSQTYLERSFHVDSKNGTIILFAKIINREIKVQNDAKSITKH